jgi:hypothetical protein
MDKWDSAQLSMGVEIPQAKISVGSFLPFSTASTHFDIQTSGSSTGVYIAPPAQEAHIAPQQN